MEVAHPQSGSSSTWFLIELEFGISKWQEIDLLAIHNHNIMKFIFQTGNYEVLPTEPVHDVKSGCQRKPGKMLKMSTEGGQQNKFILTS